MLRLLQGNMPGATRPKTQPQGRQAGGHCTCARPALLTAEDAKARSATTGRCHRDPHMGTWGQVHQGQTWEGRGPTRTRVCVRHESAHRPHRSSAEPPTSPLLGLVPYFLSQGTMFLKEETKCVSVRQQWARAGGWDGGRLPRGLGSCSAFTLHLTLHLITGTRVSLATQASVAALTVPADHGSGTTLSVWPLPDSH